MPDVLLRKHEKDSHVFIYHNIGILEYRNIGIQYWNIGILERRNGNRAGDSSEKGIPRARGVAVALMGK
jgi:hypothetical protein